MHNYNYIYTGELQVVLEFNVNLFVSVYDLT